MGVDEARAGRGAVVLKEDGVLDVVVLPVLDAAVAERRQQVAGHAVAGDGGYVVVVVRALDDDLVKTDGRDLVVRKHPVVDQVRQFVVMVLLVGSQQRYGGVLVRHDADAATATAVALNSIQSGGCHPFISRAERTVVDDPRQLGQPQVRRQRVGLAGAVPPRRRVDDPRPRHGVEAQQAVVVLVVAVDVPVAVPSPVTLVIISLGRKRL